MLAVSGESSPSFLQGLRHVRGQCKRQSEIALWEGGLAGIAPKLRQSRFKYRSTPDGRRVLTASADSTARLWETEIGNLLATFQGHTDGVFSAVFSPDGRRRGLTASGDKTARLWEAESGNLLATFQGHTDAVYKAVFSPDGRRAIHPDPDQSLNSKFAYPIIQLNKALDVQVRSAEQVRAVFAQICQ